MNIQKLANILPEPGTEQIWLSATHTDEGHGKLLLIPPEESWIREDMDEVPRPETVHNEALGECIFMPHTGPGLTLGYLLYEDVGVLGGGYLILNNKEDPGCVHEKVAKVIVGVGAWADA
jgi:hypothetical protein